MYTRRQYENSHSPPSLSLSLSFSLSFSLVCILTLSRHALIVFAQSTTISPSLISLRLPLSLSVSLFLSLSFTFSFYNAAIFSVLTLARRYRVADTRMPLALQSDALLNVDSAHWRLTSTAWHNFRKNSPLKKYLNTLIR